VYFSQPSFTLFLQLEVVLKYLTEKALCNEIMYLKEIYSGM
jgi:hypothetical protein